MTGYDIALGPVYQGGTWEDDNDPDTPPVMGVFKSTDQGASWSRYGLAEGYGAVQSIAVDPTNPDIVYAGGWYDKGDWEWTAGLFKTTDGGSNWTEIGSSISGEIYTLSIDPFDASRIYAGTVEGVYVSTDGGSSWQSPKQRLNVSCIVSDPTTIDCLFVGTSTGVYASEDGGTHWVEMNEGLADVNVNCMDLDPASGMLYVGTGGGVFRCALGTVMAVGDEASALPAQFTLHQNYPNPFNMSTTIGYVLPGSGAVQLSVFDIKGRFVRHLVDGYEKAGIKSARWDGKDLYGREVASGLYIYRLRTRNHVEMKKMILQK